MLIPTQDAPQTLEPTPSQRPVIKLSISSSMDHLPMLRLVIAQMTRSMGFDEDDVRKMEMAFEHVFSHIVIHGYEQGEEGEVEIELIEHPLGLELRIKDHGCPFDVTQLQFTRSCEPQILSQWVSAFEFKNLGRDGMETRLLKFFNDSTSHHSPAKRRVRKPHPSVRLQPKDVHIRPMTDADAAAVSKCAWRAYRYEHCCESLYRPERLRALNHQGIIISHVAVDEKKHVFAHCALIPQEDRQSGELALAFVDPRYQGQGVIKGLAQSLMDRAQRSRIEGLFVHAVTHHIHSQKAAHALGFSDTCLLLSAVRNDQDPKSARLSLVHAFKPLARRTLRPCYAPKHHLTMLEDIYRNMGETPEWAQGFEPRSPVVLTRLSAQVDNYGIGHIRILEAGHDLLDRIQEALLYLTRQRCEAIHVGLPLTSPLTPGCVEELEKRGLIFTGIWPNPDGRDHLMMQLLITQEYPFLDLHIASDLGQRLTRYIQNLDAFSRSLW